MEVGFKKVWAGILGEEVEVGCRPVQTVSMGGGRGRESSGLVVNRTGSCGHTHKTALLTSAEREG